MFYKILTIVTCSVCVAMGVYYYVMVLPRVLLMHNNAKHMYRRGSINPDIRRNF